MNKTNRNPFKYIYFLKEVVSRDIKKKYYKSILGLLWTILNPLLMMVVMTVIFSTLFRHSIPNYPIYWLCGNIIFSFFSTSTNQSIYAMVANNALLRKIYVPKYIFILSPVMVNLVNLCFSLVALVLMLFLSGTPITPYFLLLPLPILYTFGFTFGFSLILSSYGVFFRDLSHLYSVLILAWTYLTPLFYPITIIPQRFLFLFELNPLYHFISIFRDLVYLGQMPSSKSLIVATAYSALTLILGVIVFQEKEDKFYLHV